MPHGPPLSHSRLGPRPWLECTPQPQRLRHLPRSCGHHVTIMQPHTTQASSLVDLGPEGSNPPSLPSISILLHANASLIALQQLCTYLLSFLTQRLIVCAPVPCLHPHLFHPHVDIVTDVKDSGFSLNPYSSQFIFISAYSFHFLFMRAFAVSQSLL